MKIAQADPGNLVIKDTPLYPGVIFVPAILFMLYKAPERLGGRIRFDGDFFGILAAIGILLVAVGVMNQFSTFHFNIAERTLYWKRVGLFGKKEGIVPFSNIRKVVMESSGRRTTTYRLALATTEGTLPMTPTFRAGEACKKELESIAGLIHGALGKDHKRFIEDSILELVAAGKKTDAVKLVRDHYKMGLTEAVKFIDELKP